MRPLYFLVLPGVLLLDFAGPWHAFVVANGLQPTFRLQAVGPRPSAAVGGELELAGLKALPATLEPDAVVVIVGVRTASGALEGAACAEVVAWLKAQQPTTLVTVCAGALIAAQAGLLAGKRCTTHHDLGLRLLALEPSAELCEGRIFVADGALYTSAGITAGIDLALYLIGQWFDELTAVAVARELVVYLRRSGDDPQLSPWLTGRNHLQPKVHKVQDLIAREPDKRRSLKELAEHVHVSVRHLTRLFRDATGLSVHDYQLRIRVAYARRLLSDRSYSMERVAELAGFGCARSLRRAWQAEYQEAPSARRG